MFKRNNPYLGLALGACLPALAILLVEVLKLETRTGMRESTIYMICIGLNALIFRQFFKKRKENTAKGVLLITFIYALIFFIYKM
ncbi:MAG TPA: stationary phase survival protein SurE [Anseongella sp.]